MDKNTSNNSYCVLAFWMTPMVAKPQTNPRKSASQQRSRLTVDALLEATARILVREGYDRASTNRIAQVAGVSVGSLYQYFPSKEALVAAVIDRHSEETVQLIRGALIKVAIAPVEVAVRELVKLGIDAHRVDPKLHRVLTEQVPRVGRLDNVQAIGREAYALVRAYLDAHRDEIQVEDVELAAFICTTTVEALTHAAVIYRPDILGDEKANAFIDEATKLVLRYLRVSDT